LPGGNATRSPSSFFFALGKMSTSSVAKRARNSHSGVILAPPGPATVSAGTPSASRRRQVREPTPLADSLAESQLAARAGSSPRRRTHRDTGSKQQASRQKRNLRRCRFPPGRRVTATVGGHASGLRVRRRRTVSRLRG
jgi:hypothetical protein